MAIVWAWARDSTATETDHTAHPSLVMTGVWSLKSSMLTVISAVVVCAAVSVAITVNL